MRKFLYALGAIVLLLIAAVATIYFTGTAGTVAAAIWGPGHGWDLKYKAAAPDYSAAGAWAALPEKPGLAGYVPQGVAPPPKEDRKSVV